MTHDDAEARAWTRREEMLMRPHPWEKSYAPGVSWSEPFAAVPVERFLETAATRWPDKVAIDFYDRTITFGELYNLSRRAAQGLQALGVGPGIHVGLHLPNTPHYVVCFFGVLMAGGRIVNFNPHAGAREITQQLRDSDTEVLVTLPLPGQQARAATAIAASRRLRAVVVCRVEDFLSAADADELGMKAVEGPVTTAAAVTFAVLIANDGSYRRHLRGALEDELAMLQYTGGTTGDPKGAMLTHSNLSAVPHVIRGWMGESLGSETTQLLVLPFFHVFGLVILVLSVAVGATNVLHVRFEGERVLHDIGAKKITLFFGVPSMFSAMIEEAETRRTDFSSLRICGCGGSPLPAEVFHRFRELSGVPILEGYSLTEITDLGTWQPIGREPRFGSVGLPLPLTIVEVVDVETGTPLLPTGEAGEICFRGPQLMKGFWKQPEATAEAIRGGRFHTGDIGFLDEDGYVTLVGRKKDVIICGGHNVFPRRIEEAILEHPAVDEAAVLGVPDSDFGQVVKAFVVLKPHHAAGLSGAELRAFLSDKLASYEIPSEVVIRDDLPKTSVGKISKKDLLGEEASTV